MGCFGAGADEVRRWRWVGGAPSKRWLRRALPWVRWGASALGPTKSEGGGGWEERQASDGCGELCHGFDGVLRRWGRRSQKVEVGGRIAKQAMAAESFAMGSMGCFGAGADEVRRWRWVGGSR